MKFWFMLASYSNIKSYAFRLEGLRRDGFVFCIDLKRRNPNEGNTFLEWLSIR